MKRKRKLDKETSTILEMVMKRFPPLVDDTRLKIELDSLLFKTEVVKEAPQLTKIVERQPEFSFDQAMGLHQLAAEKCSYYGHYRIPGFMHKRAGYMNPHSMKYNTYKVDQNKRLLGRILKSYNLDPEKLYVNMSEADKTNYRIFLSAMNYE